MNKMSGSNNKNILIHAFYAGSFLLAVLSLIAYSVWSTRHAEYLLQVHEQKKELAKELHENKVNQCMLSAARAYRASWARACETNAGSQRDGYNRCLESPYTTLASCRAVWGSDWDDSANCALPDSSATYVNNQYYKQQRDCREYS